MRAKQRNRILILVAIMIAAGATAFGAYRYRQGQHDQRALEFREKGLAALAEEDWEGAVDGIGMYLRRFDERANADEWVGYATAIQHVPMANDKHVTGAISGFRKALVMDPGRRDAQEPLLELYMRYGFTTEATDLLEEMLRSTPDDLELRGRKADLLAAQHEFLEAHELALDVARQRPNDFEAQLRAIRLSLHREEPVEEIETWIEQAVAANPDSPELRLLRAIGFAELARSAPDTERLVAKAEQSLEGVLSVKHEISGLAGMTHIVGLLDGYGRFGDSVAYLLDVADGAPDELRSFILRRLWFNRQAERVAELAGAWTGGGEGATDIQVLRVFALRALGRAEEARTIREELAEDEDSYAQSWATVLERMEGASGGGPEAHRALREALEAALKAPRGGTSPLLHKAYGDVLSKLGEWHLAEEEWRAAMKFAPAWSAPLRNLALVELRRGETRRARALARAAVQRDIESSESIRVFLECATADVENLSEQESSDLLAWIQDLRTKTVGAIQQRLLTLELAVLAQTEPTRAAARLREFVDQSGEASEQGMIDLTNVAYLVEPDLADRMLHLAEQRHGATPAIAAMRAELAIRAGRANEALARFDEVRARAEGSGDQAFAWRAQRARVQDRVGDPAAGESWLAIANENPDDLAAQLGTLASSEAWKDREAISIVIDRVRELTGDAAVTWRMARARWLLEADDAAEAQIAEAATKLTDITRVADDNVQARVMLANALERLGSLEEAEQQLRLAIDAAPENRALTLELARLLERRGTPDAARALVDRALAGGDLPPGEMVRAATILAGQGDVQGSADLLTGTVEAGSAPRDGVLLMARLYLRMGQPHEALKLCEQLLATPTLDVIQMTAGLYERLGHPEKADTVLARLDSVPAELGGPELVRAQHAATWRSPEVANELFQTAIDAAPDEAIVWTSYLSFAITRGRKDVLGAILDDPRSKGVEAADFLRERRETCLRALEDETLQGLLQEALSPTVDRPALFRAIFDVMRLRNGEISPRDAANSIAVIADGNTELLSLQLLASELCLRTGQLKKACELSQRAARRFSSSAAAAQLAASTLARADRWPEALDAGLTWRERAGPDHLPSRVFIADAMIQVGRVRDALALLAPLLEKAMASPDQHAPVLVSHALAALHDGQAPRVQERLSELAARSSRWRQLLASVDARRFEGADDALTWYEAVASATPPTDVESLLALSRSFSAAWERFQDARLRSAAERSLAPLVSGEGASPSALFIRGTLELQDEDFEAAERAYRAALEINPRMLAARNNLAMTLAKAGNWQAAVKEAEALVEQAPDVAECLDTLAFAYRQGEKFEEAREHLAAAVRQDPGNVEFKLNLAEVLRELSDPEGVRDVLIEVEDLRASGVPISEEQDERIREISPLVSKLSVRSSTIGLCVDPRPRSGVGSGTGRVDTAST